MKQQGTILDAVVRTKHTLVGARGVGLATATVHGVCPVMGCRTLNVVDVHADTSTITCVGCGQTFDV